jgi:large subunit ribosomal protein L15
LNIHDVHQGVQKRKLKKRVGRGIGSGHGKTAGRGHKGQYASAGAELFNSLYEGGQMKLYVRFPKRGFSNGMFKKSYLVVNVGDLNGFNDGDTVDREALKKAGLANGEADGVRILGNGTLSKRLTVRANHFSGSAAEKIKAAGGTADTLPGPKPVTRNKMGTARKAAEALGAQREARRAARAAQQPAPAPKKAPKKKKK